MKSGADPLAAQLLDRVMVIGRERSEAPLEQVVRQIGVAHQHRPEQVRPDGLVIAPSAPRTPLL